MIGLRLADEIGLEHSRRPSLHYALLLKDAGCSSNAARMTTLFGSDDLVIKPRMKWVDWHRPMRLAIATARSVGIGLPLVDRIRFFLGIARRDGVTRELIQIRCDRGAAVARQLGLPDETADAIHALDEHWDGGGYPEGRRGEDIPLLSRIVNLSQTIEAFHHESGVDAALDVVRLRRGSWFDPRLVDRVTRWRSDRAWWSALRGVDAAALSSIAPRDLSGESTPAVYEAGLDAVAQAFADIIDAKSPYTFRHSAGVASLAEGAGVQLGLSELERRDLRRAGLLHDIGKLGVSNSILDKPGKLTAEERAAIERHPLDSWEILSRVRAFASFARMAALHHERLDGTGYPWRIGGEGLDRRARSLAAADVYEALTADRPYRAGLTRQAALGIMRRDCGRHLCTDAVDAIAAHVESIAASPD